MKERKKIVKARWPNILDLGSHRLLEVTFDDGTTKTFCGHPDCTGDCKLPRLIRRFNEDELVTPENPSGEVLEQALPRTAINPLWTVTRKEWTGETVEIEHDGSFPYWK